MFLQFQKSAQVLRGTDTLKFRVADRRRTAKRVCSLLWVLVLVAQCQASHTTTIELEVFTESGAPFTAAHDWMETLTESGFSRVRIRSARPGDAISVSRDASTDLLRYHVTGMITRGNSLRLPNSVFALRDLQGLQSWIKRLRTDGDTDPRRQPVAFGLSPAALVQLHDQLAPAVARSTQGQPTAQVLIAIRRRTVFPLRLDPAGKKGYDAAAPVADELVGLSAGTALSATLRPLGLVWYPKSVDGRIELAVTDVRHAEESWPVGWPVELKSAQAVPKLMEPLNVKIENQPLSKVLQILSVRMQTPILLNHNSLARHRVDPTSTRVSVPEGKSYYKRILNRVLTQSMLNSEVRQDEAGTPFFWVSSLKR